MKRAFKLRQIQLLKDTKWGFLIGIIIVILPFLDILFGNGDNFITQSNAPSLLKFLLLSFIPLSFSLFMIPFLDGISHFDSALRFGISRQHYFYSNLIIYSLSIFIGDFISALYNLSWTQPFSTLLANFFASFHWLDFVNEYIVIMLVAIFFYAFYKFGSKIFIIFLVIPIVLTIFQSLESLEQFMIIFDKIQEFINYMMQYIEIIVITLSLCLTGIYYLIITKIDIQN